MYKKKEQRQGLSWVWLFLIVFAMSAIISWATGEQKMKVEMYDREWVFGDKWLNIAKEALRQSNLPSKDVAMITDSLNAFQLKLYQDLQPQFQAQQKALQDSVKKKNEKPKQ